MHRDQGVETVVNATFAEHNDVVKKRESLRGRLQEGHHCSTPPEVYQIGKTLYYLKCGAAVQPRTDLYIPTPCQPQ